ncbi:metalloendopeptidase OMA1, mitochondrial-like [Oscarella lobularis]|uniref:metalloendopeptidase OMA1, mitochondrial-like n=1 Tax=Oscarella lobularis TaxID=121494 RepID=UPI0033140534
MFLRHFLRENRLIFLPKTSCRSPFHVSSSRNAFWLTGPVIYRVVAFFGGKFLKRAWKKLPEAKRNRVTQVFRKNRLKMAYASMSAAGLTVAYYGYHLESAPITERKRFITVSKDDVNSLSNILLSIQLNEFKESLLDYDDIRHQRVKKMAFKLVESNQLSKRFPEIEWKITVINSPVRNAFVMPNGVIVMFTGMLDLLQTDDMLAGVLGHEMAHAVLEHMREAASRDRFINFFSLIITTAAWIVLPDVAAFFTQWFHERTASVLLKLPYSRKLENEADAVGLTFAAKACFDVREVPVLWRAFQSNEEIGLEWQSTHPDSSHRAESLELLMPVALAQRNECKCATLPERNLMYFEALVQQVETKMAHSTI